ncbi:MAG: type I-C CRISPR-associated protein Cas7/Csd2 [Chloroflexota bacterium]|nr:type I-C CRISPR-associated protein Cas7/Csd2 [Chloroflexota bacterium]
MTNHAYLDADRRHDFVLFFDVTDGNPNGDPDAGNLPRVDPETMQGLVTDVAIKRKVRDFVDVARGREGRYKIYVQGEGVALNAQHRRAYEATNIKPTGSKQKREDVDLVRAWMCDNFYDIRTFGAVMSTKVNCGQVRGPLQLTFARSVDPIVPLDVSITRIAVTDEGDAVMTSGEGEDAHTTGKTTEMGRKAIVPYGLYRAHGFYNPHLARQTGFQSEDLELFWEALLNMWDLDRSAARGLMACRGVYVFSHDKPTGNAPAHRLFERIQVVRREGIAAPRAFGDYLVTADEADLPEGITLSRLGV